MINIKDTLERRMIVVVLRIQFLIKEVKREMKWFIITWSFIKNVDMIFIKLRKTLYWGDFFAEIYIGLLKEKCRFTFQ